eukprot:3934725-Rhodomonas_salina.2
MDVGFGSRGFQQGFLCPPRQTVQFRGGSDVKCVEDSTYGRKPAPRLLCLSLKARQDSNASLGCRPGKQDALLVSRQGATLCTSEFSFLPSIVSWGSSGKTGPN